MFVFNYENLIRERERVENVGGRGEKKRAEGFWYL